MALSRVNRLSVDGVSLASVDDLISVDSGEQGNEPFFGDRKPALSLPPSHTSSATWKSTAVKEKEEFERIKQRVRHVAPGHFRAKARPGQAPADILPQNVGEWMLHKKDMLAMAQADKAKNCERLRAQILASQKIPRAQRKVKSVLGRDGKVFQDGLGPVLCLPTIWSSEHSSDVAKWPSASELQRHDDRRPSTITRCTRFLPPPQLPQGPKTPLLHHAFVRPFPLDQTGPLFSVGPRPDEVQGHNAIMDADPGFEALARSYLGSDLMDELGAWRPPCIPEWRLIPAYDWRHASSSPRILPAYTGQDVNETVEVKAAAAAAAGPWLPQEGHDSILDWESYAAWW